MPVLLVRHAVALPRQSWAGDDEARPLNERGRRQAEGLVTQAAPFEIGRVLSSPSVRCADTVQPLAAARGLPVELLDDLAEGRGGRAVDLLRSLIGEDGVLVLCTHGDVIDHVLVALEEDGARFDDETRCQKGSTWVLEQGPESRVRGRYLPPPT